MKALQKDVDDKKAERETLLYVGYIRHVCTIILSIPRMQIYTIYISICMSCSLATAISSLHLHYICGTGPAEVPHEGGDDEAHVEVTGQDDHVDEATLSPRTQKCGLQDQQM